jgi:DNA-binding transcriptional LysR family regulator
MLEILSRQFANLLVLKAAVDAGSINKAATALRTSQPGVTRSISRLEAAVGCKLIERSARGIVPTEFGRLILGHVELAAAELQTAGRSLALLQRSRSGDLLCGAANVSMNSLVPAAVHQFLKGRSNVNVRLIEAPTHTLLDHLRAGDIDLVVGVKLEAEDCEGFHIEPLLEEIRGIYGRAGHRCATRQPCRMDEILRSERWVFSESTTPKYVKEKFQEFDLAAIPTLVRTQSTAVMRWYARSTDFLVISTSLLHYSELLHGEVVEIKTDWTIPATQHVIYRKARNRTPKAALEFIDFMKAAVKSQRFSIEAADPPAASNSRAGMRLRGS